MVKQLIHGPITKLTLLISGLGSKENRRHPRARIKWPVVMNTPNGLVDGRTKNLSLGGAFVRCPDMPHLEDNFRLVLTAKERLILVNAEVVWSDGNRSNGKSSFQGMGIRFTKISINDRAFLSGVISAQG